jgi:multidrug resistance efflux pump
MVQKSTEEKLRRGNEVMRKRITIALAVAAVAVIAAIVSYLWRVFRIGQTSKTNDAETEDGGKCHESKE